MCEVRSTSIRRCSLRLSGIVSAALKSWLVDSASYKRNRSLRARRLQRKIFSLSKRQVSVGPASRAATSLLAPRI